MKRGVSTAAHRMERLWRLSPSTWLIALAMAASIAFHLVPFYLPATGVLASMFVRQKAAADLVQSDPAAARMSPKEFESAVERWTTRHSDALIPLEQQAARTFRDALTFDGDDGARHAYLGGADGYYWLKLAGSMLTRGTVCDRIERGVCIDALGGAPLGQQIEYTVSPHVYLIAALQRFMAWLRPGFPLSSTAMLVPLVLSALVVIPAFSIAEGASNRLGGLIAALLLAFNSLAFVRGSDSDDDIWIVALPVLSMGFITAAFARRTWSARIWLSGLGGITLAILAAAWKGWPLFALYTLAGLITLAAWAAVATLVSHARGQPRSHALVRTTGLCTLSVIAGFVTAGWLLGIHIDVGIITSGLASVVGHATSVPATISTAPMPNVFRLVAELAVVKASSFDQSIGTVATGLGLLGFALPLWVPSGRQSLVVLLLLVLVPAVAALLAHNGSPRAPMLAVPAFLGLAAAIGSWLAGNPATDRAAATGILGLAWLGATLWMSFEGLRYLLLAVAPLSVAAGISVGRVAWAVSALASGRARFARAAGVTVAGGFVVATLGPVVAEGLGQALRYIPEINSAWTKGFAAIRAQSSSDAIVDLWWDYGHWAKYYTDRAVVLDGASLQNQSVHWMARSLAATSDAEAVGLLRVMNCGAVSDPDGGPPARPYDMLVRWSADPGLAFRSMTELSLRPREQAAAFLRNAGLPSARASALLQATYCTPPQSFLVLSTDLFYTQGWLVAGLWDPGLAYIVELAHHSTVAAAVPMIEKKYGLPEPTARDLYMAASRIRTEDDRVAFATPGAQTWSRDWQPCVSQSDELHCTLDLGDFEKGPHLQDVAVDPENPERTRIRIVPRPDAAVLEATPALVEIARPDRLQDVAPADATVDLGVLVDPNRKRVFIGTPRVVHSTLVRLALLDGRYSPQFQKIFDQLGVDQRRVTVWRIVWRQP